MRTVIAVCVIIASAFIGPSVSATLSPYAVLDQSQENWNVSYDVGDTTMMAQTFTAGLTGTLDHIEIGTPDFGFESLSTPQVDLYLGQPGSGWTFLTSFSLSDSGFDKEFDNYSVLGHPTTHIRVDTNTVYSIVLDADDPWTAWVGAVADLPDVDDPASYEDRGALWTYDLGTWKLSTAGDPPVYDMQFRTYVVPVPLPAGVWLGICAVSVAGWHLKRQRG